MYFGKRPGRYDLNGKPVSLVDVSLKRADRYRSASAIAL